MIFFKLFYITSLLILCTSTKISKTDIHNNLNNKESDCQEIKFGITANCTKEKNDLNTNLNFWKAKACMPKIANNAYDCYKIYKEFHLEINCNLLFIKFGNVCTVIGDIDKDNCEGLRNTKHTKFYLEGSSTERTKTLYKYILHLNDVKHNLNKNYRILDIPTINLYIDNRTIMNSEFFNIKTHILQNISSDKSVCNYIIYNHCLNSGLKRLTYYNDSVMLGSYCFCPSEYSGNSCEITPEQDKCNKREENIVKKYNEKIDKCEKKCLDNRCGENCEKMQEECNCIYNKTCTSINAVGFWNTTTNTCNCNCINNRFGVNCNIEKEEYNCINNYCTNNGIGNFDKVTKSCSCTCHSTDCGSRCDGNRYRTLNTHEWKCTVTK
jgi:hypothetical protein